MDTTDQRVSDYNRGVIEGMKHATPSTETARRLLELENWRRDTEKLHEEQRVFMAKLEGIPEEMQKLNRTLQDVALALEGLKPVRMIVYGGIGLVLTSFMGGVVAMVIKS